MGGLHIVESVSDVNGTLHFVPPKSGRTRIVHLAEFLGQMLDAHLAAYVDDDPDALLFTTERGATIRANNWRRRVFYPAVSAAGIDRPVRIHDLRHTAASLRIDAGVHPKAVADHLGHASISTTMDVYGHLFDDSRDRTSGALDDVYRGTLQTGSDHTTEIGIADNLRTAHRGAQTTDSPTPQ